MTGPIEKLLSLAETSGDRPDRTIFGWNKFERVYWMSKPMSVAARELGRNTEGLEYTTYAGDPHNRADESFIDRARGIAISFPKER